MPALAHEYGVSLPDPFALDVRRLILAERGQRIRNERGDYEVANDRPIHGALRICRYAVSPLASQVCNWNTTPDNVSWAPLRGHVAPLGIDIDCGGARGSARLAGEQA
jgi:hypothetical protein